MALDTGSSSLVLQLVCVSFRSVDGRVRRYDIRFGKLYTDTIGRKLLRESNYIAFP